MGALRSMDSFGYMATNASAAINLIQKSVQIETEKALLEGIAVCETVQKYYEWQEPVDHGTILVSDIEWGNRMGNYLSGLLGTFPHVEEQFKKTEEVKEILEALVADHPVEPRFTERAIEYFRVIAEAQLHYDAVLRSHRRAKHL